MNQTRLIVNAKVWQWRTDVAANGSVPSGVAKEASILIRDGIIQELLFEPVTDFENFTTVIDAKGSLILPGLMDSHVHVGMLGESQHYVNLGDCETIKDMQETLRAGHMKEPDLPFLIGFNWDQEKFGRFPQSSDLEDLGIDKPIFLWRACWHIAVVNRQALVLAKILDEKGQVLTTQIEGGAIDLHPQTGYPTGIIRERAVEPIIAAINESKSFEQRMQFVQEGLQLCLQSGLTAVQTNDEGCFDCYEQLAQAEELPLRVFLTPNYSELAYLLQKTKGPVPLASTKQRLAVERVKIFSDGSLGAATAAIKDSSGSSSYQGILIHSRESLVAMISEAQTKGFRVEIHAIGDAAAEQVLSAMEESSARLQVRLNRPILTHCQVLSDYCLEAMQRLEVVANIQPSFVPTDMRWVQQRLHPEQLPFAYAWKTLLRRGVHVAGGSDAPIETPSPLKGLFDAVFRSNVQRLKKGEKEEVFRGEECLSLSEAIWIYSKGAAFASGYEDVLGEIQGGFAADLVLVDAAVIEQPRLLYETAPRLVMVDGQVEYLQSYEGEGEEEGVRVVKGEAIARRRGTRTRTSARSTIPPDAPYIPGKAGHFLSQKSPNTTIKRRQEVEVYCGEIQSIGYCSCRLHSSFSSSFFPSPH